MLIRSTIAASFVLLASFAAGGAAERGPVVVALNPQPEPPGSSAHVSGFVLVALNPQPEPPGDPAPKFRAPVVTRGTVVGERAAKVALNPQPEPPGIAAFDARRLLPPGPCSSIRVTVETDGMRAPFMAHAVDTATKGKCAFTVPTPGAKAGSGAAIKFSRD